VILSRLDETESKTKPESGDRISTDQLRATLEIERGETSGTTFQLSERESNIGRWDADNGIFPDIDLDSHDPESKVSRRHARIFVENGRFVIEDLGSTNGTFVNRGRRLIPGNRHLLSDGDEIIVGKTFLRFHIG
jgi:serine/threonine-protein kinase